MSTFYKFVAVDEPIGQTHSKGREKGTHFTWCIFPLQYARLRNVNALIRDEYGNILSMRAFEDIVDATTSQSFDERIV